MSWVHLYLVTVMPAIVIGAALLAGCGEPYRPIERGPHKVGVTERNYHDESRGRPQAVRLWYPAKESARESMQNYDRAFAGFAAQDAELEDGEWPLVLLSHGDKGNNANQSWLAEYLASRGYIVAAPNHWLNTTEDYVPEETVRVWHRPGDVSFVLDQLETNFNIDIGRISAIGHSAGGYTALALAGAVYKPELMQAYCSAEYSGPACDLAADVDFESIDFTAASNSLHDSRISKVVALAPALGPAIDKLSLQDIQIPVLLSSTPSDEVLSVEYNAHRYRKFIPHSQWLEVPAGGHFVYLSECNRFSYLITLFFEYDICGSHHRIDRRAMHELAAREISSFLASE